jgi:hypothetical protein
MAPFPLEVDRMGSAMGDRADTSIMIVGVVPSSEAIQALAAAAVSENAKAGWEEGVFEDAGEVMCLLQGAIEEGNSLWIYGSDKLGATMDDVEDACRAHGLAFEVHGERGPSWDSFVKRWMPSWEQPLTTYGDADSSIGAQEVKALLDRGAEGLAELALLVDRQLGVGFPDKVAASPELGEALEHLIQVAYGEVGSPSAPAP